ncbi:MAG: hypothetical protein Q9224_004759, partial [Gallowayella concinna]
MLARAAKEHTSGWRSSQPRTLEQALKPLPPTATNAAPPAAYKNPLKRTASQVNGTSQQITKAALSRSSSGMLGKLHNDVYFDENDFEDDNNLDLNDVVAHNPSTVQYPTLPLPNIKNGPTLHTTSSQPIPWSSSPLDHHRPETPRELNSLSANAENSDPVSYPSLPDGPKPSKRRTIPWLGEEGGQGRKGMPSFVQDIVQKSKQRRRDEHPEQRSGKGVPPYVQAIIERNKNRKHGKEVQTHQGDPTSFTPLPKDKTDSPYPWNKTASALKEEQKRLRQGHKNRVKNHDAEEKSTIIATTNKKHKGPPKVFLSDEQKKVLDLVVQEGKSVFFTGSAGTGKSVLLRKIIDVLRVKYNRESDRLAVTASTGLAACNVGGVTLHSFAGIGLGKEAVPELVRKIKRNAKAKNRWMRTKVLIVDEISMVDGDLFDKLEAIAR